VKGLVDAVSARTGDAAEPHPLFWAGKTIQKTGLAESDNTLLSSLGLSGGSTLEMLVPLKGGAQCGKSVKGRSKEKAGSDDLAAKMRWLQEQAAKRIAGKLALPALRLCMLRASVVETDVTGSCWFSWLCDFRKQHAMPSRHSATE